MEGHREFLPLENGKWLKVYSDGKTITNCDLISFDRVLDRWKGATQKEIYTIILEGKLDSYFRNKSLRKVSGIEHYLFPFAPNWNNYGEGYFQDYDGVVCLLQEVLALENKYPDFLCEPVPECEVLSTPPEPASVYCTPSDGKPSDILKCEHDLSKMRERLEEVDCYSDEAKKRAANAEQFVFCRDIDGHGLCSLVIRMRQEGKTDEEIAEFLSSSRRSLSQIGALLHTDPEATQAAQVKLAQRLLGKA